MCGGTEGVPTSFSLEAAAVEAPYIGHFRLEARCLVSTVQNIVNASEFTYMTLCTAFFAFVTSLRRYIGGSRRSRRIIDEARK